MSHAVRSPLVLALAVLTLVAALAELALAPPGTSAGARPRDATSISGWSRAPGTVAPGRRWTALVAVSGGRRAVLLQRRGRDGGWRTTDRARSRASGRAALTWRAPTRVDSVVLRVRVPQTRRSAEAVTQPRQVRVTRRTAGRSDPAVAEVLRLVNRARGVARACGEDRYPAVPPLARDARLERAAQRFAQAMGEEGFFSHTGPDGSDPGDRISAEGYPWRNWAENIAAGYPAAQAVVDGWLASPGHCANLMSSTTEIGIGHAEVEGSPYGTYWVQDFASR